MAPRLAIFSLQLLSYACIGVMILYGSLVQWLIALFMYFAYGCLGMIMTYHRLLSHRSFPCPRWWEYLGTILATFSLTGSAITWVAIHRKHHRYSDTPEDPHSPDHMGWWRVQFLTAFSPVDGKYAKDLMRDRFYVLQHRYYLHAQLAFAAMLYMIDPFSLVYAWLFPASLTLLSGTLILSTSHRDFKPHDSLPMALITWGDAFHEVHHRDSKLYRLHRFDITGIIIDLLFMRKHRGQDK